MNGVIVASFETETALREAMERLRAGRIDGLQTYTPKGLEDDPGGSFVPLVILIGGCLEPRPVSGWRFTRT
jgi:hypothetical protein